MRDAFVTGGGTAHWATEQDKLVRMRAKKEVLRLLWNEYIFIEDNDGKP